MDCFVARAPRNDGEAAPFHGLHFQSGSEKRRGMSCVAKDRGHKEHTSNEATALVPSQRRLWQLFITCHLRYGRSNQDKTVGGYMLKDRLSPADEAARDAEMRETLATCPRILDLIARGALADPDAQAIIYLRSPLDPNPVVISNDHLMGAIKAAETFFRAQGIETDDAVAILLPFCPAAVAAIWG